MVGLLGRPTAIFVDSVFSAGCQRIGSSRVERKYVHCDDVCWASSLRLLVFCTPGSDSIAEMRAFVVYLGVITHGGKEMWMENGIGLTGKVVMARLT